MIGRFWVSHHGNFAMLRAIDPRLVVVNLVYLAFVCLIPYPTNLLGGFNDSSVSVALYALVVGIASLLALLDAPLHAPPRPARARAPRRGPRRASAR